MDRPNQIPETSDLLRKRSLTDEVYEYLSDKIIAGNYSSGDWLRQEDISSQLGVSQTPVREALDRLVASGLAERVPYRGVRVPILDTRAILDAFMLRIILETTGARQAAKSIQPAEVQDLLIIVEKTAGLISLDEMSTLRHLNKEFHTRLVEAARSPLLSKLYEMTTNAFPDWMLYEYMFRHPELLQSSLKREYLEHKGIVAALGQNDPESAGYQVASHILNLGHDLQTYLEISGSSIQEIENQVAAMFPHHQI